jgi:hypothetical protein
MKLKSSSKEKKETDEKTKGNKCSLKPSSIEINSGSGETKKKFETINRELNEKFKLNCISSSSSSNNHDKQATVTTPNSVNGNNLIVAKMLLKQELDKQINNSNPYHHYRGLDIKEFDFYNRNNNNSIDFDCDYDYDLDDENNNEETVTAAAAAMPMNTFRAKETCKCCVRLPPPPSPSTARLDLLRQLKVYLELYAMYPSSSSSGNGEELVSMNALNLKNFYGDANHEDNSSMRMHDESFISTLNNESVVSTDNGVSNNNNNNRQKLSNEMMNSLCVDDSRFSLDQGEEENEYNENGENSKINLVNGSKSIMTAPSCDTTNINSKFNEKIKPLIPLNAYIDDTSSNYLNNYGNISGSLLVANKCSIEPFVGREWIFKEIDKVSNVVFSVI